MTDEVVMEAENETTGSFFFFFNYNVVYYFFTRGPLFVGIFIFSFLALLS